MFQFNSRPGMMIQQVLKRTGPKESYIVPHQSVCPSHRRRHTTEGGVPHNLDPKHPEHGSDAPS
ncbi:hypothetical protein A2U01_0094581, partial [Trifolium medium]|nr:hypothetical protein [Trifolium medium]